MTFHQLTLDEIQSFDSFESALKAIKTAEAHATETWKQAAMKIVKELCEGTEEFTSDSLWQRLDQTMHRTHDNRAAGAIILAAARKGWCRKAGWQPTKRPEAHGRPVQVWQPLLHPSL